MIRLAALLALAVTLLPAPALAASGLAGTYNVEGWNPGHATSAKADYTGTLTLADAGDGLVAVWAVGEAPTRGLGIVSTVNGKRLLSVGYNDGETGGIAVYEVSADGQTLSGLWGPGAGGHEVAKRAGARQI